MNTWTMVREMKKLLGTLDGCLQKGVAHATARGYDPNVLLQSRLAPDMFPLLRQIQAACDNAKLGTARLTGKEAPSHPDTEQTMDEARARIGKAVAWLDSLSEADFAGADARRITQPRWEGRGMSGAEYLSEYVLPNFFFHLTTSYAILRHNGVDVGKRDYLGPMPLT
jgi:hypothetical protein